MDSYSFAHIAETTDFLSIYPLSNALENGMLWLSL